MATGLGIINPFSISNFKTAIVKPVRPNLFSATLSGYKNIVGVGVGTTADLPNIDSTFKFRCEKAELPGRTLATSEDAVGSGPSLKLPYDVTYNDMTLSIICSTDMKERIFFEQWMDKIIGPAAAGNAGLLSYYSDYAMGVTLKVEQLDESGQSLITYTLHDIYPTALTPMNASWEENNTYQRFGVTLAYRYHTYE